MTSGETLKLFMSLFKTWGSVHHLSYVKRAKKCNKLRFGGFPSYATVSVVVYYFIQIIPYMLWTYDHFQVEIYTSEINVTGSPSPFLRVLDQAQGFPSNATLFQ
jgi:hypothetical protein